MSLALITKFQKQHESISCGILTLKLSSAHLKRVFRSHLLIDGCILRSKVSLLQAETEQKEIFAAALAANRKALDESRQDRGTLRYEVDAKNRKAEALATELHLTETSLSERQAEVALLKGHERDYLQKIATLEVSIDSCCNLQRQDVCRGIHWLRINSSHAYIAGTQ